MQSRMSLLNQRAVNYTVLKPQFSPLSDLLCCFCDASSGPQRTNGLQQGGLGEPASQSASPCASPPAWSATAGNIDGGASPDRLNKRKCTIYEAKLILLEGPACPINLPLDVHLFRRPFGGPNMQPRIAGFFSAHSGSLVAHSNLQSLPL